MIINTTSRAFTILEIVIIIAIIGIVALISLPLIQSYRPTLKLNAVSRDLATDLRYAQQQAVTEQISYQVSLDLVGKKYQIIKKNDGAVIKTTVLPNDITWSVMAPGFTDNKIEFVLTGAVVEAGQIILTNQQNNSLTVDIKPSGYVKLYHGS